MSTRWKLPTLQHRQVVGVGSDSAYTASTLALDSGFTYGSAGDGVFYTFFNAESANLTDFWIKVSAFNGTWGGTDGVVNVQIREGLAGSNIPGTTLAASFTITLDGVTTGWIRRSGLSIALVAGQFYSVVIGDEDGSASNYVTLVTRIGTTPQNFFTPLAYGVVTTANGFSSAGTNVSGYPAIALQVGSLVYAGTILSTVSVVTNTSDEKGLRFRVPENCTLIGFSIPGDTSLPLTGAMIVKLYADATAPGGTALVSYTPPAYGYLGSAPIPYMVALPPSNWVDLVAGSWYRLVLKPPSTSTTPRKIIWDGSPDADLKAALLPFNGDACFTIESSGTWADDTDALCALHPVLMPNTDAAPGGAGGGLPIISGSLIRGLR